MATLLSILLKYYFLINYVDHRTSNISEISTETSMQKNVEGNVINSSVFMIQEVQGCLTCEMPI